MDVNQKYPKAKKATFLILSLYVIITLMSTTLSWVWAGEMQKTSLLNPQYLDETAKFWHSIHTNVSASNQNFVIMHLGDSHVQTPHFGGAIKSVLSSALPPSASGLLFPYSLCKSYGPPQLIADTAGTWTCSTLLTSSPSRGIGPQGYVLYSQESGSKIQLKFNSLPGIKLSHPLFVRIFHGEGHQVNLATCSLHVYTQKTTARGSQKLKRASAVYIRRVESDQKSNLDPVHLKNNSSNFQNANYNKMQTEFYLSELSTSPASSSKGQLSSAIQSKNNDTGNASEHEILSCMLQSLQSNFVFKGVETFNSKISAGLVYHKMGLVGAKMPNLLMDSLELRKQISLLRSHLIILSYGTNESYAPVFNLEKYVTEWEKLLYLLQQIAPQAGIILTFPPYTQANGKKAAWDKEVRLALNQILQRYQVVGYDLGRAMGGEEAFINWYRAGLVKKDGLHFEALGYKLQGESFGDALLKVLSKYK